MTPRQHKRPLWVGIISASLAPAIFFTFFAFALQPRAPSLRALRNIGALFALAVPVSLVAMLCLGLPFILWLRSRNALNPASVCAGAAVIGVITFALFTWGLTGNHHRLLGVPQLIAGAAMGLAAGIGFCVGSAPGRYSE